MLKTTPKQLSLYSVLYDKIPENHILKVINKTVDFSFVNKLLEDSYSKKIGRPAKEPEMMAKLLILQYLYNLSDVRVIEEVSLNLAYMWFVGINPDEELPDASLLAKFRTQRLKDTSMDDIIQEVVHQCIEKGIIKSHGLSIDATHTAANTTKKVPERIMKHLAKKIFKTLDRENGKILSEMDTNIPDYKAMENHEEAKTVMKTYLEEVIAKVQESNEFSDMPCTQDAITEATNIISDEKFILQKGIRSLIDQDARVGYKSKTDSFFGYKVEFAMIPEERIITAIEVSDGAYVDGSKFEDLYKRTKTSGFDIKEFYGDKGYFRKPILDILKEDQVETIIPVSASVYKLDDSKFSYNKDSDQWFCERGNYTISKKCRRQKNKAAMLTYTFDKKVCINCPNINQCINGKSKVKQLSVGINAGEYYEYSQRSKTAEFQEKYKKRASHEWKNGEMKRFHGLDRARGYGLRSMTIQAKLTVLAVNLKRIASLVSSYFACLSKVFSG